MARSRGPVQREGDSVSLESVPRKFKVVSANIRHAAVFGFWRAGQGMKGMASMKPRGGLDEGVVCPSRD